MMKKMWIFVILSMLLLTGCIFNEDPFTKYFDMVDIPTEVTDAFLLPGTLTNEGNHDIYWKSSNSDVLKVGSYIEKEGLFYYNAFVYRKKSDIIVTLTMQLEINGKGMHEKEFEVKVLGNTIEKPNEKEIAIFSLNDFHGSVVDSNGGISVIGNYILKEKETNPNTVVLSSGDMFQGSAISNMTRGNVLVEIMNEIGFDSMTVGNHEFDWGIDVIKNLNNKTSEVKANFPLICSNIYNRSTGKPVDWCKPYTIVQRDGIKIGIIGAIGAGLESSIATSIVSPFEFKNPYDIIKEYTLELRKEKECDLVIVSIHNDTTDLCQLFADLSGDYQIDALFNGHTHNTYAGETTGKDGYILPYIQSGSNGKFIGKITLKYDVVEKKLIHAAAENIEVYPSLSGQNKTINSIIEKYNEQISGYADEVIGVAGIEIYKSEAVYWGANVCRDYASAEIGFINSGGIRANAFPIRNGSDVTIKKVYEIMPFDNFVKTCTLTTSQVIKAMQANDVVSSDNVTLEGNKLYVNGKLCQNDQTFKVAAVDYIFDKVEFPFLGGTDIATTGELYRDYLIQAIKDSCKNGKSWVLD